MVRLMVVFCRKLMLIVNVGIVSWIVLLRLSVIIRRLNCKVWFGF